MLKRDIFSDDHELFRSCVKELYVRELSPRRDQWEKNGMIDRDFWLSCGTQGMLLPDIPEAYGGGGLDFRVNAIVLEEISFAGVPGAAFAAHNDMTAQYIHHYGREAVKRHWLPKMAKGEAIGAVCMTEPDTGSDLKAIKTRATPVDGGYLINGAKTFITNGISCDVAVIAARVGKDQGAKAISLFVCDVAGKGFQKGRKLDKVGHRSSDTAELFFEDMFVPAENLLGEQGSGFIYMMEQLPQERMSITVSCQAAAQHAFDLAVAYVKERKAFGKAIIDFQNTRFVLADIKTELQVGWAHLDACIQALVNKQLSVDEAAAAKLWHSELCCRVADACLQLFGGYGYTEEYDIARLWRDVRVTKIYGGTSEIMKEIIGRSL
ncbi:MAG: acyl-CoA dehydrogenase family protein [Desulfobacterales bacterium]|jgi:alkylation response protein AidB-like acyl-CoA dehydrogenase|nr:acyl-CoA dehydrogenase family protein [Desulfobacterales bacterium]